MRNRRLPARATTKNCPVVITKFNSNGERPCAFGNAVCWLSVRACTALVVLLGCLAFGLPAWADNAAPQATDQVLRLTGTVTSGDMLASLQTFLDPSGALSVDDVEHRHQRRSHPSEASRWRYEAARCGSGLTR